MNHRLTLILLTAILLVGTFSFSQSARSQEIFDQAPADATNIEVINHTDGSFDHRIDYGNYAYLTRSNGELTILDNSDPTQPHRINQTPIMLPAHNGLMIYLHYLYVLDNGFWIYDLSDPTNPVSISRYNPDVNETVDFTVFDNYAYLVQIKQDASTYRNSGRIQIMDFSDPSHPQALGYYNASEAVLTPKVIGIVNGYAIVIDEKYGILTVRITDPYHPVGGMSSARRNHGMVLKGYYGYLATSDGLEIYDFSDPTARIYRRVIFDEGIACWTPTIVKEDNICVSIGYGGKRTLDISNPLAPTEVNLTYRSPDRCPGVSESNDGLIHSWREIDYGIGAIDNLALNENYLYLSQRNSKDSNMLVLNISDPTHITKTTIDNHYGFNQMLFQDGLAYFVGASEHYADEALTIIDMNEPLNPVKIGLIDPAPGLYIADMDNEHTYWITWDSLTIYDLKPAFYPHKVGEEPHDAYGARVKGDFAYVSGHDAFWVMDIHNPEQPRRLTHILGYDHSSVSLSGDYVYLRHRQDDTMGLVNISDPYHPVLEKTLPYRGQIIGNRSYQFDSDGMHVYEITTPSQFDEIAYFPLPSGYSMVGLGVTGDTIVLGTRYHGFYILHYTGENTLMLESEN